MAKLWSARSQHMGLPISFTKYYIEDGILFRQKGFFTTNLEQVRLYRIIDFSLTKNLLDKIFRQGTIIVKSKDKTMPTLELVRIPHPEELLKSLNKWTEEERKKAGFKPREIIRDNEDYDDTEVDDEMSSDIDDIDN